MTGTVLALARDDVHAFSKPLAARLDLLEGLGVAGDAHCGATVQHRSRLAANPPPPNLRQVHLLHAELLEWLAEEGFSVSPGELGENITTFGVKLLDLPTGTRLSIGESVVLELTGLRNPCRQIEAFSPGLLARLARKMPNGRIERLAGVMAVVRSGGPISIGDVITAHPPATPHQPLRPV